MTSSPPRVVNDRLLHVSTIDTIANVLGRYGLVVVIGWIGALKFANFEAHQIQPLVAHSPFMGWLYNIFRCTRFQHCWVSSRSRRRCSWRSNRWRRSFPSWAACRPSCCSFLRSAFCSRRQVWVNQPVVDSPQSRSPESFCSKTFRCSAFHFGLWPTPSAPWAALDHAPTRRSTTGEHGGSRPRQPGPLHPPRPPQRCCLRGQAAASKTPRRQRNHS
jgi:hypothetical protein